jgi:excisionase family DNA binding protein
MTSSPSRRLMTLGDTATFLKCSRSTLYKYVERSAIPHIKIGGRIRFSPDDLDAWIAARSVKESSQ